MNSDLIFHLVMDIESVLDHELVEQVGEPFIEMRSKGEFLPYLFHVPKVIGIASVRADYSIKTLTAIKTARDFWKGWLHYEQPQIVTYNGRGFDLPLLEAHALLGGIQIPQWFRGTEYLKSWKDPRSRFNLDKHLDLQEWVTNFGACPRRGGLNLLAKFLGLPGKFDGHGSESESMSEKDLISYCMCDVLDTYLIWLHTRVVTGDLTTDGKELLRSDVVERVIPETIEALKLQGTQLEVYQKEVK